MTKHYRKLQKKVNLFFFKLYLILYKAYFYLIQHLTFNVTVVDVKNTVQNLGFISSLTVSHITKLLINLSFHPESTRRSEIKRGANIQCSLDFLVVFRPPCLFRVT